MEKEKKITFTMGDIKVLVQKVKMLSETISRASGTIDVHKTILTEALEERKVVSKELIEALAKQDVLSKGNTGWEMRTVEFLKNLI